MISWAERRGIVRSDKDDPRHQRREVTPGELGNRRGLDFSISIANGQASRGAFTMSPGLGMETLPAQASPRHSACRDNLVRTVSSIAASTTHRLKHSYLTGN